MSRSPATNNRSVNFEQKTIRTGKTGTSPARDTIASRTWLIRGLYAATSDDAFYDFNVIERDSRTVMSLLLRWSHDDDKHTVIECALDKIRGVDEPIHGVWSLTGDLEIMSWLGCEFHKGTCWKVVVGFDAKKVKSFMIGFIPKLIRTDINPRWCSHSSFNGIDLQSTEKLSSFIKYPNKLLRKILVNLIHCSRNSLTR